MLKHIKIESVRRHLREDGCVVIPEVIGPGALEKLRDRVALFYRAWQRYPESTRKEISPPRTPDDDFAPVREINWPEAALRLLDEEPAVAAIRRIVDALAETRCRIIHVNSLLKPATKGAPVLPHQDTAYNVGSLNCPLTVWIPFEKVTETSGALYYLPGSHKLGDLEHKTVDHVRWLTESQLGEHGNPEWRTYSGEPGSIGIHDSRLVHGSYVNRSDRDRLALSVRFAAT